MWPRYRGPHADRRTRQHRRGHHQDHSLLRVDRRPRRTSANRLWLPLLRARRGRATRLSSSKPSQPGSRSRRSSRSSRSKTRAARPASTPRRSFDSTSTNSTRGSSNSRLPVLNFRRCIDAPDRSTRPSAPTRTGVRSSPTPPPAESLPAMCPTSPHRRLTLPWTGRRTLPTCPINSSTGTRSSTSTSTA